MNRSKLKSAIMEVPNVSVEEDNNIFTISANIDAFKAVVNTDDVNDYDFMISPVGQICVAIRFNDGGMVVVMPDDFVFNVIQEGGVEIDNLPGTCSLRGLVEEIGRYADDPEPSDNIEVNIGLYFMHKYLVQSAKSKGFDVSNMNRQLSDAIRNRGISAIIANMEGNS